MQILAQHIVFIVWLSLFSYSAESVCSISNLLLSLLFLRVALPRLFLFGCDAILERNISCAACINTLVYRCWRLACFPVWSCFSNRDWLDVLSSSSGMGSELLCLAVCFLDGAAFAAAFCVSASVSWNPSRPQQMAAHTEPGSAGGFFLFKGSFLLSTVATSMLSVRDCWRVNESMQSAGFP